MSNLIKILTAIGVSGLFLSACTKVDIDSKEPQPYKLAVPSNFPAQSDDIYNPLTEEGVALGRRLFYDKKLSGNNMISCASCHKQSLAFSDGVALSNIGVSGTKLLRHSPALINMFWAKNGLFWDGGSTNLESQAFGPLSAHDEMAQNLFELIEELQSDPQYPLQFIQAFNQEISSANIVKALAQFQRTLVSANSKYDRYIRKENNTSLTSQELQGLATVQQKCQPCHATDLFTDHQYHNNGLDNDFSSNIHEDIFKGRFRVSFNEKDLGAYRTPTLRNVMLTAPYMHDGRLATIQDVLNHYATAIKTSPSLSPKIPLDDYGRAAIALTQEEKNNIIAFLHTLTDDDFINNKKFSNPNQ